MSFKTRVFFFLPSQQKEKYSFSLRPLRLCGELLRSKEFIEKTKAELGIRAKRRGVRKVEAGYELREPQAPYGDDFEVKNGGLRLENAYFWNDIA